MMGDEANRDAAHAARLRRLDPGNGVLEYHTPLRRHRKARGRDLEHLRIGLAALRVLHGDDGAEEVGATGQLQNQVEVGARGAGADRLPKAVPLKTFE